MPSAVRAAHAHVLTGTELERSRRAAPSRARAWTLACIDRSLSRSVPAGTATATRVGSGHDRRHARRHPHLRTLDPGPTDRQPPRAGSDRRRLGDGGRPARPTRPCHRRSTTPPRGRRTSRPPTSSSSPASPPSALDIPATVEAREIAGVHVNVITPEGVDASDDAVIHLDIHGGALDRRRRRGLQAHEHQRRGARRAAHVGRRLPHAARPPLPHAARRLRRGVPRAARACARPTRSSSAAVRQAATSWPRCCCGPRTRACRCLPRSC